VNRSVLYVGVLGAAAVVLVSGCTNQSSGSSAQDVPASAAPSVAPSPTSAAPVGGVSKRDLYAEAMQDNGARAALAYSGKAYRAGQAVCERFEDDGVAPTVVQYIDDLGKDGQKLLMQVALAATETLCPEFDEELKNLGR
jgi:hypothetical protein